MSYALLISVSPTARNSKRARNCELYNEKLSLLNGMLTPIASELVLAYTHLEQLPNLLNDIKRRIAENTLFAARFLYCITVPINV